MITRRWGRLVALSHHDPAYVFEHLTAVRLATGRAHEDDAGLAARILLEPNDFGLGIKSVSGIDRRENAAGGIAEIGDGVERDVRYRLAEHDVEDEEIIDRRARIADRTCEDIRGLHGKTRTEQAIVERDVPDRDGARNGMLNHLADVEVFEKVTVAGLRHMSTRSFFGRTGRAVRPASLGSRSSDAGSAARERETTGPREFAIGRSITAQLQKARPCRSEPPMNRP